MSLIQIPGIENAEVLHDDTFRQHVGGSLKLDNKGSTINIYSRYFVPKTLKSFHLYHHDEYNYVIFDPSDRLLMIDAIHGEWIDTLYFVEVSKGMSGINQNDNVIYFSHLAFCLLFDSASLKIKHKPQAALKQMIQDNKNIYENYLILR